MEDKIYSILDYNDVELFDTTEDCIVFIDQQPAMEFNRNEFGWPRNDISAFELASSDAEAELILSRLQEQKDSGLYKDMSEREMFDAVCPRRAMSDPVLYERFQMKLANIESQRLEDARNEAKDKENSNSGSTISFEDSGSKE